MHEESRTTTTEIQFRYANRDDVPAIVALLADDELGSARETANANELDSYLLAFDDMQAQGGNNYLLAIDNMGEILGCAQLTLIPGLSRSGMKRAQIEGVRVSRHARGLGVGRKLFKHVEKIATASGCGMIQLTTDRTREEALKFYEALGYEKSHWGMKRSLE